MSKQYNIYENGQKTCVTDTQLQELARQGKISPETLVESEDGRICPAGVVSGLEFPEKVPSSEPGAFTPVPMPDNKSAFTEKKTKSRSLVAVFGILLVFVGGLALLGGFIVWGAFSTQPLVNTLKEGLDKEIFSQVPMEIADISVEWTNKTGDSTTGNFSVKAKTLEKLYKLVDNAAALEKLGVTDLFEKEFNDAEDKFQSLPSQHHDDLRDAIPQDLSKLRFYDLLVPEGDEVTLTGSVELNKHTDSGKWLVGRFLLYPYSCGDDFVAGSQFQKEEHKLDDPKTKKIVNAIIQDRRSFAAKVKPVWDQWQHLQQEEEEARKIQLAKQQQEREARKLAEQEAERKRREQAAIEQERQRQEAEEARERQRQAARKDLSDNFSEFCKPGMRYKGNFRFDATYDTGTFEVIVVFREFVDENTNKVDGLISIRHPGGTIGRPFSVTINTKDGSGSISGIIDNSRLPALDTYMKTLNITTRRGSENAKSFYEFLSKNVKIDIQFSDDIQFSLNARNGPDRVLLDLSPDGGNRPEIKRTVVPDGR